MMIPLGILASGMKHAAANITMGDGTVWAGGRNSSGQTGGSGGGIARIGAALGGSFPVLTGGATYTVTVGAAGSSSSALGVTAASNGNTNRIDNGINQTWSSGFYATYGPGWYYPNYFYGAAYAYGGGAGAASSGQSGTINPYGTYGPAGQGGPGGAGTATYVGSGVAGLGVPAVLCGGGGGGSQGTTVYNDNTWTESFWQPSASAQTGSTPSANSGTGGTIFSPGYSGGFVLAYPSSQAALTATTGTVTTVVSGGMRYYFWKSSGSFTV